jgi:hypothetical protein
MHRCVSSSCSHVERRGETTATGRKENAMRLEGQVTIITGVSHVGAFATKETTI